MYALMTFEQFATHRRQLKGVIKFSKCETEFYAQVKNEDDFEDCRLLTRQELDEHLEESAVWNPDAEVDGDMAEDLSKLKKSELVSIAEELAIDLPSKTTKAQIIALIEEA